MATATEILWTDPTHFTFTSAAGAAGAWATNSNAGWSGGSANQTTTVGDKVTITWTGRSLYLLNTLSNSGVDFTIATDGVTRNRTLSQYAETPQGSVLRSPLCVERNLTDGAHTTVLQSITTGSKTQFSINSIIAITGTRTAAGSGKLAICGDSWAQGVGAQVPSAGWVNHLWRRLCTSQSRDLVLSNRGVSGAAIAGRSATNSSNAMQQLILVNGDQPEILALLFGVNDLVTINNVAPVESPGVFAGLYRATLQFVEDLFDTTSVTVIAGTPPYVGPALRWVTRQAAGSLPVTANGGEIYETAINLVRQVFSEFAWLHIADVYAAMDRRTGLVYPNYQGDLGLHPNEQGHSVVADEFFHAYSG